MHVYMLKSKDQATAALAKYKAEVENAVEKKIKTIRSDHGGGSFCQQLLQGFVRQLGSGGNSLLPTHRSKTVW